MTRENTNDNDEITFTTDNGTEVTVTAEAGQLYVTAEATDISIDETAAVIETNNNDQDVLNLGNHRVQGTRQKLKIRVNDRTEEIETLREDSKDDTPLTYEVEEYTKTTYSWGKQEITKQRLSPSKSFTEMSDREQSLSHKVNTDSVPNAAEPGDVLTLDDLLDDARTREEKDEAALEQAAETGEEQVISQTTTHCSSSSKECNIDHVTRVATPAGDIETRRTHTY